MPVPIRIRIADDPAAPRVGPGRMMRSARGERARMVARWVLAIAYGVAGILHVRFPDPFLTIMPAWVPLPRETVLLTGLCEIAGAIGLVTRRWRRPAAIGLAAYAVCVYPANIQHAINDLASAGGGLGWRYHAPRLALQPVIVWWALHAGGLLDWPFAARHLLRTRIDAATPPPRRRS